MCHHLIRTIFQKQTNKQTNTPCSNTFRYGDQKIFWAGAGKHIESHHSYPPPPPGGPTQGPHRWHRERPFWGGRGKKIDLNNKTPPPPSGEHILASIVFTAECHYVEIRHVDSIYVPKLWCSLAGGTSSFQFVSIRRTLYSFQSRLGLSPVAGGAWCFGGLFGIPVFCYYC